MKSGGGGEVALLTLAKKPGLSRGWDGVLLELESLGRSWSTPQRVERSLQRMLDR